MKFKIIKLTTIVFLIISLTLITPSNNITSANDSIEPISGQKISNQAEQIQTTKINLTSETIELKKEEKIPGNTGKQASAPKVATLEIWEKIAACESGGRWSINTGNGYYGGLQFSEATWLRAGGGQYAPFAHLATKEQQIAVADSWLAKTSWSQWGCAKKVGIY